MVWVVIYRRVETPTFKLFRNFVTRRGSYAVLLVSFYTETRNFIASASSVWEFVYFFFYIYLRLLILKIEFVCCVRFFELVTQTVHRDLQQCETDCLNCDVNFIFARTGLADAVLFGSVLRLMTSILMKHVCHS
jgi:hypothetical protein